MRVGETIHISHGRIAANEREVDERDGALFALVLLWVAAEAHHVATVEDAQA